MSADLTLSPVRKIEQKLSQLIGLRLADIGRAGDTQIFDFGTAVNRPARIGPNRGKPVEIYEFSLHVQCGWRISREDRIVLGYHDLLAKVKNEPGFRDWPEPDALLLDLRRREFLDSEKARLSVIAASVDDLLGFRIDFDRACKLEVFPMCSSRDENTEYWRFFARDAASHLVVSCRGLD